MVLPFLLAAWLAADQGAAAVEATPVSGSIPDEAIVLELRKARIAGQVGDVQSQRTILTRLLNAHPDDPTAIAAALAFWRDSGNAEETATLRAKLLDVLGKPGRMVPLPLIQEIARDSKTSPETLGRLVEILAAQPGTGSERVARLRLRAALLERLERRDELTATIEDLASLDADPILASRLLRTYRDAGRWDDILRATSKIQGADAAFETGWWRVEALAQLGRLDELSQECGALIGRLKGTMLEPYVAEKFFPIVFRLVDAGRLEAAERLTAQLQGAGPDLENVKKLRVMLFGTPESRVAYLNAAADATLASADPDKIRNEAYQRLLGKDFKTAHQLYQQLGRLDPAKAEMDASDWFNDGLAAIELSAWTDAEASMSRAITMGPPNARALGHRARARIMLAKPAEGMADAEAALKIDPKCKQAFYALYLAYQKNGNAEKAAEWLARYKAP